jgi:hypothetical protein
VRRLLVLVAILTAGCSPAQEAAWMRWFHRSPKAAVAWAVNECGQLCTQDWDRDGMVEPEPARGADQPDHPGEEDHWAPSGQCPQWYGTAIGVGFDDSEWPTVDRIMYAESRCDPSAYNGASGVTGLMQIMQFWAEDCGGIPSDLYDPWFNLACALHVRNVQGWGAWVTY